MRQKELAKTFMMILKKTFNLNGLYTNILMLYGLNIKYQVLSIISYVKASGQMYSTFKIHILNKI